LLIVVANPLLSQPKTIPPGAVSVTSSALKLPTTSG